MTRFCFLLFFYLKLVGSGSLQAQSINTDEHRIIDGKADLNACIRYALDHHPLVEQLRIRDRIARRSIALELSDWLPHIELNANFQHFIVQPVSIFPDFNDPEGPKREVTTGVVNSSSLQFGVSQTIYSPDVVIAGTSAKFYKRRAFQTNQAELIELVLNVSKAFYDVLLTEARLDFFLEDRARMDRSFSDAYSLYETGLNDKIDHQRARISLNNIDAEIAGTREEIKASYALLKELMGYPASLPITIRSDSNITYRALLDTTVTVSPQERIEYQLLSTNIMLQHSSINYQRLQFFPSLTAFANYNLVYQNDDLSALYDRDFPNSAAGIRITLPLFEGGRKLNQLKIERLRLAELIHDSVILRNRINTEFANAMAAYKTNLKTLEAVRENALLADEIYNTVRLQYNQGIKSFLEVIISEADLRTSRINELNALYRLITSKLDVDAALGRIEVNY